MYNTKLKFEIPFNLDPRFIDWVNSDGKSYKEKIEFIYMPCFHDDCRNSRELTPAYLKYNPFTRTEYNNLVQKLHSTDCDIAVLMQDNSVYNRLNKDLIKYYIDLGFKYFIVGDDNISDLIKSIDNSVYTVASLTKVMTFNDVMEKDLSMYDIIVLHHWANRAVDSLKYLPQKYKYVLMVDIACTYKFASWCKVHWFHPDTDEANEYAKLCCKDRYTREVRIFPEDYYLFEPYLHSWKLGFDRGTEIEFIIENMKNYMDDGGNFYKDDKYYNMKKEDYYNLAIKEGYVKLPNN